MWILAERLIKIIEQYHIIDRSIGIVKILDFGCKEFVKHGCNDVPNDIWNGWSKSEKVEFCKMFHELNSGDNAKYFIKSLTTSFYDLGDIEMMWVVSEYFKGNVKFTNEKRKEKLLKIYEKQ